MSRKSRTEEVARVADAAGVKLPRIRLSMRWSIVSLLTLLIIFSAGLIILVSYLGGRQSTQYLMDTLMEDKAYRFIDKTSQFLMQAHNLAEDAREEIAKLNTQAQRRQLEEELRDIFESQPYYSAAYWLSAGKAVVARHQAIPEVQTTNLMDELDEDRNSVAANLKDLTFEEKPLPAGSDYPWQKKEFADGRKMMPLHRVFSQNVPGFTFCSPVNAVRGISAGAVCVDITLGDLALYIGSVKVGETGRAFIADKSLNVLAAPQQDRATTAYTASQDSLELRNLTAFGNAEFSAAYLAMNKKLKKLQKNKRWLKTRKPFYFDFKHSGSRYVGIFTQFPRYTGLDWQAGVIIPEDEFFYFVRRNTRIVIAASTVLVLLAVILGYIFSRRLSRPLNELAHEMDKIQNFDLTSGKAIVSSITDVDNMVMSFYKMRQGLRSFGKFVPADIVRQLIAQEGDAHLQGEKRQLTVHFSDIEGFTTVSESIPPEQLVELLAEYLGEMSRIIGEENGTVDKYIGDAVMAFWGAPQTVENHAHCAARAALRCQKRLAELETKWQSEGKPVFRARIGLNTGDIIVGNMGSAERLNYTVIGDAVNLASRLEGINKYYGTRIIVGETTQALIAEKYATRLLDFVAVKGKSEAIRIYELVCEKSELDQPVTRFIAHYEAAVGHYRNQQWDAAEKEFRAALAVRTDEAAEMMLGRIAEFRRVSPPADWNGEYVMNSK
ncbi:MAG: adenylate/guanylate cyclase domain-containing protein [Spirochaetota bacterium]